MLTVAQYISATRSVRFWG